MSWISRKADFPDCDEILCCAGKEIFICELIETKWGNRYCSTDGHHLSTKEPEWTHWMPLPEPPKQEKQISWIDLDDEIPKNNQKVRFRSENTWIAEGIFQDNKFVYAWVKGGCFGDVTHWMPLPEAANQEKDKE